MSTSKVALMVVAVLVAAAAAWRILQVGSDEPLAGAQTRAGAEFVVDGSAAPMPSADSRPDGATVVPIHAAPFRDAPATESRNLWHVRGRVVERPVGEAAADPKAEGPPVAGVQVTLKSYPGRERREEPRVQATAITGKDGSFDLAVGAPAFGQTFLAAVDSDLWSGVAGDFFVGMGDPEPAPLLIRAERFDATIFGTVKDAAGAPVVGAKIGWAKKVSSDAEGAYRLPILSSRRSTWLWASAPGFENEHRQVASPAAGESLRIDFVLAGECVVEGVVRKPDGTPLEGATTWTNVGGEYQSVVTRADGSFRLGGFSPKEGLFSQSVGAEAPGYLPVDRTPIFVDRKCRLEVTMVAGAAVRGVVVDGGGLPIDGVQVRIGSEFSPVHVQAFTGRDGGFTVAAAPSGPQHLEAKKAGLVATSQAIEIPASGLDGLRIVMGAGHRAGGRVEDEFGKPVGGVWVSARHRGRYVDVRTKTAADGRFLLEALPAEGLEAEVYGSGYLRRTAPILAGREDAVIVMKKNGKLAGRVVDAATSEPLTRFTVRIVGPDALPGDGFSGGYSATWGEGGTLISAKDGVWRIDGEDLAPGGVFGVEISAEGYARGTYGRLVAEIDPEPKAHVMALKKASTVGGVVVTAAGSPVADAEVSALSAADKARQQANPWSTPLKQGTTDAAGKFVIRDAPGGMVFVRVAVGERPPFDAGPFSVPEGGAVGDLRIVMPEGAVVQGLVVGPNGRPTAGATVVLVPLSNEPGMQQAEATADAEGRFAFRGLLAGSYFVDWRNQGSWNDASGREIVLAEAETIDVRLPPDAPCSVRIQIAGAEPLPSEFIVNATPVGDSPRGVGRARRVLLARSAAFVVDRLDEGEYSFSVSSYSSADPANGSAAAKVVPGAPLEIQIKLVRPKRGG